MNGYRMLKGRYMTKISYISKILLNLAGLNNEIRRAFKLRKAFNRQGT